MKKKILGLLALQMGLSAPHVSHALTADELLGGILGGVGGALLCNELAGGRDRTAVTAACAIGGALLGSAIGGQLSRDDQSAYRSSMNRSMGRRVGERDEWRGDNHRGYTEVVRTGYYRQETTIQCREIRSVVTDNYGRTLGSEVETSCYRQDRWIRVETTEVVYGDVRGGGYNDYDRYDRRDDRYGNDDFGRPRYESINITNERLRVYLSRLDRAYSDNERLDTIRRLAQDLRMSRQGLSSRQLDRVLEKLETRRAQREARSILINYMR